MRRTTLAVALAPLLALAACGGGSSSSPGSSTKAAAPAAAKAGATVTIPLLSFDPVMTTVKAGQTVTWVNGNDIDHVLVEGTYKVDPATMLRTSQTDDKAFNLQVAKKGDTVEHTYATAGTFTYYCTIHQGMNATVVVTP